ncbi:hypothetical protein BD410DRAFT_824713 [Rickenella mellea]|uniref:Uncharacterized protein n=1 Tax=Rickenella mellea TaxID=50990 RepID=A0A4Y7QJV1_9AGAM|nr:hypothetical protein BD410DRAFT_824713 [Rickenella mellea]
MTFPHHGRYSQQTADIPWTYSVLVHTGVAPVITGANRLCTVTRSHWCITAPVRTNDVTHRISPVLTGSLTVFWLSVRMRTPFCPTLTVKRFGVRKHHPAGPPKTQTTEVSYFHRTLQGSDLLGGYAGVLHHNTRNLHSPQQNSFAALAADETVTNTAQQTYQAHQPPSTPNQRPSKRPREQPLSPNATPYIPPAPTQITKFQPASLRIITERLVSITNYTKHTGKLVENLKDEYPDLFELPELIGLHHGLSATIQTIQTMLRTLKLDMIPPPRPIHSCEDANTQTDPPIQQNSLGVRSMPTEKTIHVSYAATAARSRPESGLPRPATKRTVPCANPTKRHHPTRLINNILQAEEKAAGLKVVGMKWNAKGNCILFTHGSFTAEQLAPFEPRFRHIIAGKSKTEAHPDRSWSRVILNGIDTGKPDRNDNTPFTPRSGADLKEHFIDTNPQYATCRLIGGPKWLCSSAALQMKQHSSIVLTFEDPSDADRLIQTDRGAMIADDAGHLTMPHRIANEKTQPVASAQATTTNDNTITITNARNVGQQHRRKTKTDRTVPAERRRTVIAVARQWTHLRTTYLTPYIIYSAWTSFFSPRHEISMPPLPQPHPPRMDNYTTKAHPVIVRTTHTINVACLSSVLREIGTAS